MTLKIYKVLRRNLTEKLRRDDIVAFVCLAPSAEDAVKVHPLTMYPGPKAYHDALWHRGEDSSPWVRSPDDAYAVEYGVALDGLNPQILAVDRY